MKKFEHKKKLKRLPNALSKYYLKKIKIKSFINKRNIRIKILQKCDGIFLLRIFQRIKIRVCSVCSQKKVKLKFME